MGKYQLKCKYCNALCRNLHGCNIHIGRMHKELPLMTNEDEGLYLMFLEVGKIEFFLKTDYF
jgi:hypothetical protein